jgi:hypothetical protein
MTDARPPNETPTSERQGDAPWPVPHPLPPRPTPFEQFVSREWPYLVVAAIVLILVLGGLFAEPGDAPPPPTEMTQEEKAAARKTFRSMFEGDAPLAAEVLAGAATIAVLVSSIAVGIRVAVRFGATSDGLPPPPVFERPPHAEARWNEWDALKLAFVYVLLLAVTTGFADVLREAAFGDNRLGAFLAIHSLVGLAVVFIAYRIIATKGQNPRDALGLRWRGLSLQLVAAFCVFCASMPVFWAVSKAWTILVEMLPGEELSAPQDLVVRFATSGSVPEIVQIFVAAGLVAPLTEEFFFRGMLYGALRQRVRRGLAIAFVSVCFGAVHLPALSAAVPMCVLGAVLCYVYERTGRLAVPVLLHAIFNLFQLSVLISYRVAL